MSFYKSSLWNSSLWKGSLWGVAPVGIDYDGVWAVYTATWGVNYTATWL